MCNNRRTDAIRSRACVKIDGVPLRALCEPGHILLCIMCAREEFGDAVLWAELAVCGTKWHCTGRGAWELPCHMHAVRARGRAGSGSFKETDKQQTESARRQRKNKAPSPAAWTRRKLRARAALALVFQVRGSIPWDVAWEKLVLEMGASCLWLASALLGFARHGSYTHLGCTQLKECDLF